jgi:Flp pilus assembly protein TadG
MTVRTRAMLAAAGISAAGLAGGLAATAGAATTKAKKDTGTSYVAVVHQVGNTLDAAGYTFDKLRGQGAITYQLNATPGAKGTVKVQGKRVVMYTSTGTLYGTGSAVQNIATGQVSAGKLALTHGTAAQKGHSFVGTFTGTYNRANGVYTFHYTGTYK